MRRGPYRPSLDTMRGGVGGQWEGGPAVVVVAAALMGLRGGREGGGDSDTGPGLKEERGSLCDTGQSHLSLARLLLTNPGGRGGVLCHGGPVAIFGPPCLRCHSPQNPTVHVHFLNKKPGYNLLTFLKANSGSTTHPPIHPPNLPKSNNSPSPQHRSRGQTHQPSGVGAFGNLQTPSVGRRRQCHCS